MAKQTVQGIILERLAKIEGKLDLLLSETIPNIKIEVVKEATNSANVRSMVWGTFTIVISIGGLLVAYFK